MFDSTTVTAVGGITARLRVEPAILLAGGEPRPIIVAEAATKGMTFDAVATSIRDAQAARALAVADYRAGLSGPA